jgi:GNAT superfamily N-acetyltransferase
MQSYHDMIKVEVSVPRSARVIQIGGLFDVPIDEKLSREWSVSLPLNAQPWDIGLIVGSSGSGKSTIAKHFWLDQMNKQFKLDDRAVVDSFDETSIETIIDVFSSIGFNTIPSWLKPFHVLSNGEQFRVMLARRLLSKDKLIVVDEFTSVVDRQVAKVTSHVLQKHIRKTHDKQFIAVSCHYDIIDWLQPDWVYDVNLAEFKWRRLRRRPELQGRIERIDRSHWHMFSSFHYMSAELSKLARCFGLFVDDCLVGFAGVLPRAVSRGKNAGTACWGVSRLVVLPDYQGLGLAFILLKYLGALYKRVGRRFRIYPAHPSFVKSCLKNAD